MLKEKLKSKTEEYKKAKINEIKKFGELNDWFLDNILPYIENNDSFIFLDSFSFEKIKAIIIFKGTAKGTLKDIFRIELVNLKTNNTFYKTDTYNLVKTDFLKFLLSRCFKYDYETFYNSELIKKCERKLKISTLNEEKH